MAPARTPRSGHAAYASLSVGLWVARRLHHGTGLFSAFHHRYQQTLHAQVQILFDQNRIAHRQTRQHLVTRNPGDRLGLHHDGGQGIGRMFAVNQQPVKAGPGAQLGAHGVSEAQP